MTYQELRTALEQFQKKSHRLSDTEQAHALALLLTTSSQALRSFRESLREQDAAAQRRKAKRRETEVDPKPPIKPVRVAAPSKPRKPKYSGL